MHRVYMSFMQGDGWYCHFLEEDLKTPLPKKLAFLSQDMIRQLARRGGAAMDLEAEQANQTRHRDRPWWRMTELNRRTISAAALEPHSSFSIFVSLSKCS